MSRQREGIEEQPRRRRKKKKRFGYYLYAVMILILTVANITIATFLLTYVQRIKVSGTKYSTDSQVVNWIKEDPLTMNSIYAVLKHKIGGREIPAYLESVKVGWNMPWGLQVQVEEKEVIGGVLTNNAYVYFAEDGTVMKKGSAISDEVFMVEGVKVKKGELYQKMELNDEKLFSYITSVLEELKRQELTPDRIIWEDDSMNVYFGDVRIQLGKLNYDEKILHIPPILEKLEGKKGVLHLEHYSEMNTNVSFNEISE